MADLLFLRPIVLENAARIAADTEATIASSEKPLSIFVVPYLSLISEKETKLTAVLKELNLTSVSIHSHKRAILSESSPPDIVICTI